MAEPRSTRHFAPDARTSLSRGRAFSHSITTDRLPKRYQNPHPYISAIGAENYAAIVPDLQEHIENDGLRRLHEMLADTDKSGPPAIPVDMTASSPALAIVDYATDHDMDMIVMGTHGRGGLAHLVMGSVAERVVRLAPCPVLTVRRSERDIVRPDTLAAVGRAS